MTSPLARAWVPLCALALRSACTSAPRHADAPAQGEPVAGQGGKPADAAAKPGRSPYAPAQEDPNKRGDYVAGGLYAPHVKDSVPDYVPDVDAIPEPEVVPEPRSRYGNRSYAVLGKRYHVMDTADGYLEQGTASFYGKKFHGRRTSNQEVYDMYAFSAAHKSLPLPSFVRVTNLDNGKSVVVRVNDRGPFHAGRIIDLSYAAAVKLDFVRRGTARVEVQALSPEDDGHPEAAKRLAAAPAPVTNALPADEFERWMQERGIRFASGEPAVAGAPPATEAPPAPAAAPRIGVEVASATTPAAGVLLQVAAFSTAENAERARTRLMAEGLDGAHVVAGEAVGRPVWRLRVGPVDAGRVEALSARLSALGFDAARVVRD